MITQTNPELQLARRFIEETSRNIFLTGKAGTGKTTFLRELRETSHKRMIVVAPTGIAAMNAGGVTIHSFFQLSFAPYIPDSRLVSSQKSFFKFGKEKVNIIKSLNLLVIDEVSMVRADLLDAVDGVLRRFRDRHKPFGGVQLLMIGDMQQLAPVVKEDDQQLLADYYDTNYFFSSHALQKTTYSTIELKQVYRQQDMHFLNLLNKIRTGQVDDWTIDELNKRYIPHFKPTDGYITLTTHNNQAQRINEQFLASIDTRPFVYEAKIVGEFPEYLFPIDRKLVLKQGAQVMFVKNDSTGKGRYYNGKLGTVTRLDSHHIEVLCQGESYPVLLETEAWLNNQYTLNPETREIVEKELGAFVHYPIKLAWAITIHKSQGLTFERAVINANASFAHGQVYVALSRCKTLEGLVLSTPLTSRLLIDDEVINNFTRRIEDSQPGEEDLLSASRDYYHELVNELFDFAPIERPLLYLLRMLDEHFYRTYPKLLERYRDVCSALTEEVITVADKFRLQYTTLFRSAISGSSEAKAKLEARIQAGAAYFEEKLTGLLTDIVEHPRIDTDNKELARKFTDTHEILREQLRIKLHILNASTTSFSVSAYLAAKAVASLPAEEVKVAKTKKAAEKKVKVERAKIPAGKQQEVAEASDDLQHPRLYRLLKAWRDEEARKTNLPVYTVIQQKAMLGITNRLPSTKAQLEAIPYIGKRSVEKYGDVILEIVEGYVNSMEM